MAALLTACTSPGTPTLSTPTLSTPTAGATGAGPTSATRVVGATATAGTFATSLAAGTAYRPPTGPLVEVARWVSRDGVRSLRVTPTALGRDAAVNGWDLLLWEELVRRYPQADRPGMRDQLTCHLVFAPTKATWNLEPGRPDVGYAATVAAACNPGGVIEPSG